MKEIEIVLLLVAAIIGSSISFAQEDNTALVQETWLNCNLENQKVGYAHSTIEKTKYHDKDCYKINEELIMHLKEGDVAIEIKDKTISYLDMDFSLLYVMEEEHNGSEVKNTYVTKGDGGITVKILSGKEKPVVKDLKNEKGVSYGFDGYIVKTMGLIKVGASATFKSISLKTGDINTEKMKVLREEKVKIGKEEINTFYIEVTDTESPDSIIQYYVDKDGNVIKAKLSGLELTKTTKTRAMEKPEVVSLSSSIKTNARISSDEFIAQLKIIVAFDEEYKEAIPDNEYQEVTQAKTKYTVTLKSISMDVTNSPALPITDEAMKPYLNPSLLIQSKDEVIIKQAKEIIKDEKDPPKMVKLLCEWIPNNLKNEMGSIVHKSAKETLKDQKGESPEYAALFCALGRSLGIPVKEVGGLIFDGRQFSYHVWNEVYLGKWFPVDSANNRVGIPACYLKLGENEEGERDSAATVGKVVKIIGNAGIQVVSAKNKESQPIDLTGK